jgi:hypothetical protein
MVGDTIDVIYPTIEGVRRTSQGKVARIVELGVLRQYMTADDGLIYTDLTTEKQNVFVLLLHREPVTPEPMFSFTDFDERLTNG